MEWFIVLTFLISFVSGILGGIGGGGGGFIIMPYYLFIGLPPANALATAKLGGIGSAIGSIAAFKGKGLVNKALVYKLMTITFVCAVVAAWFIPKIDPALFENIIGIFLILLIPTLFINKSAFKPGHRSHRWIVLGFVSYTFFSFLQSLVGTGMGSILILVLMYLFGLGALESNATKRVAQSVQAILIFVLLAIQGLVYWWHGVAGLAGSIIGSHIGSHIALKKGARFVKVALAVVMFLSGVALLI